MKVKRYGKVIGVRADKLKEYKALNAELWPGANAAIEDHHVRNYSVFLRKLPDGQHYLFMYFEYTGKDYAADMQKIADEPAMQEWWKQTDPCLEPLPDRQPNEWWADMEEVCHSS
jgi:L-rhamnose mutarotase